MVLNKNIQEQGKKKKKGPGQAQSKTIPPVGPKFSFYFTIKIYFFILHNHFYRISTSDYLLYIL